MTSNQLPVVHFQNVSKAFLLDREDTIRRQLWRNANHHQKRIQAIKNLSFKIFKHETTGLYGPNGSGKSTILRLIAGILQPDTGDISVTGKVAPVIELGTGLHPDISGLDNIFLYSSILQIPKQQIKANLAKIIRFSGLKKYIHLPIKKYSSGMKARLAFSIAAHSKPDILLIDEIISVGDQEFKNKSLRKIKQLRKTTTIIFTSHDIGLIQGLCDKALELKNGQIISPRKSQIISFLKQLPSGYEFITQVGSNSMYPILKKGDQLTIKKIPYDQVKPGDIIAFTFKNIATVIVHRVVKITGKNPPVLITKGDNAFSQDQWQVDKENYLGIVKL